MDRIDCLRLLARRQRARSYLEIGVRHGETFFAVPVRRKIGVDPVPLSRQARVRAGRLYYMNALSRHLTMTSDEFFERHAHRLLGRHGVDLVFIDGKHTYEQSLRDIENAVRFLSARGLIVVHDTNPATNAQAWPAESIEDARDENPPGWDEFWCGDVWKGIVHVRATTDYDLRTLAADFGITVINPRTTVERLEIEPKELPRLTFEDLDRNRTDWLCLCSLHEFESWLEEAQRAAA